MIKRFYNKMNNTLLFELFVLSGNFIILEDQKKNQKSEWLIANIDFKYRICLKPCTI